MAKGSITRWPRRLWRGLGSSRLTLVLLAALLLATLLASLLPQMPAHPAAQMSWLSAVSLRYGRATPIFYALGLFNAYHSAWYLALLGALVLNTAACTLQRLPRLWRSLTRLPRAARPEAFYQGFARHSEWPVSGLEGGLAAAQETLLRHRYRLQVERNDASGCAYVFAERGGWAKSGTVVSHLSAAVLILALAARPVLGWQSTNVTLLSGDLHTVDLSPPFTIRAGSLQIERYPNGEPRDYQVPLAVVSNTAAMTKTVHINQPLRHRGIGFHLQGYGPAARVLTPEGDFDLALDGSQAQELKLPHAGLTLRIAPQPEGETVFVEALSAEGRPLGSGPVSEGQQVSVGETPITFELGRYTVWQVSHDPTFGVAVAAACLLLAGIVISLWMIHERLWLRLDGQKAQMVGSGDPNGRFEAVAQELAASTSPSVENR